MGAEVVKMKPVRAFTLVEMMMVLAIIAVLGGADTGSGAVRASVCLSGHVHEQPEAAGGSAEALR